MTLNCAETNAGKIKERICESHRGTQRGKGVEREKLIGKRCTRKERRL